MKMLVIETETQVVFFHLWDRAAAETFRAQHPVLTGGRIRAVEQALPGEIECGVIYTPRRPMWRVTRRDDDCDGTPYCDCVQCQRERGDRG